MVFLGSGTIGRDVSTLDKAGQILSAFELPKRYLIKEEKKIQNTDDVLALVVLALVQDMRDKKQDCFLTITLTGASALIEKREVLKGTVNYGKKNNHRR